MKRSNLVAALGGALVAGALAGGIAWGAIGDGGVIQGCYDSGGNLKVVAALPCPKGYTSLPWNQQGPKGQDGLNGTTGTNGTDGEDGVSVTSEPEPAGANCQNGGSKFTAVNGTTYACNGAPGTDGADGTLASLDSVNGLACTRSGQTGTAQIVFDPNGVATITCVVTGPPPTNVPPDGVNNVCAIPVSLGSLSPGLSITRTGTTSPAATEDWFQVAFSGGPLHVTLTADPGIKFDILGACGTTLDSAVTAAQVSSPSPFLIRVYGDAGVTGSWTLRFSNP